MFTITISRKLEHLDIMYTVHGQEMYPGHEQEMYPGQEKEMYPGMKTLEWNILYPDRLINLEIKNKRRTSII